MKRVLVIFGTRPEAIKLAPLILEMRDSLGCTVTVCVTGQHREMLDQVLEFFQIIPDHDLHLMVPNQSLATFTGRACLALDPVLDQVRPDVVVVQGDTTTTLVGGLAAFYRKVPVAHVEAGLRSGDISSPWPEEMNRKVVSVLAHYHFAPTEGAVENLRREGIVENVYNVGNTAIDALKAASAILDDPGRHYRVAVQNALRLDPARKTILVTAHRRENLGERLEEICRAVHEISTLDGIQVVFPMHLNPAVRTTVRALLSGNRHVHLVEPLDYPSMIWLMRESWLILTDSGGIQEEAPSLGKPVIVLRDVTERMEGVRAGNAILVGASREKIVGETSRLLSDKELYNRMSQVANPYGDGRSCSRIADVLAR